MVRRDGGVTLIDFGVAHMSRRAARARAQLLIGKSGYLAPELFGNALADARSDVFSAGVVLHELLAGRHLFIVDSERETLQRVAEAPIPPPSRVNPHVTRGLDAIVLRALHRDPAQRFASANEMADALEWLRAPRPASHERVADFVRELFGDGPPRRMAIPSRVSCNMPAPPPSRDALARPTHARTWLRVACALAVLLALVTAPWPELKLPTVESILDRLEALSMLQLIDPQTRSRNAAVAMPPAVQTPTTARRALRRPSSRSV